MSVTVTQNFDLKKISLDLTKELNRAGQIVKTDHFKRLERGEGVRGSKMKALSPNTIAAKGNDKILVKSGKMRNLVIEKATKQNQEVVITNKVNHPGLPKREWFGISKKAEQRIVKMIGLEIEREIKRA